MGYKANEQPMISAISYYYDRGNCASLEFCENVLLTLKKYRYDAITNIELGKHRLIDGILEDYIVRYGKKDLSMIDLKSELLKWVNDDEITYISFVHKEKHHWIWDITWHKNYRMPDGVFVSDYTFNYLGIESSYEKLENKDAQNLFIGLFCDLSDLFESFYGRIEDVSTAVQILDHTREKVFNPKRIQFVYWGNYLSKEYCLGLEQEKLERIFNDSVRSTDKRVFFTVTDDLLDSRNNPNIKQRKNFLKYLSK